MKGYGKIARLMGKYPESAMVRQFSDLNLQNILYLQAELSGLEQDFRRLEAENDESADEEKAAFSLDWYTLSSTAEVVGGDGDDEEEEEYNEQWQLALTLREKLKEYNEAVIQYAQISSLSPPKARDLHNLQEWMRRPTMGNVYLVGRDRHVWSEGVDLVALKSRTRTYPFAGWLMNAMPSYHSLFGRHFKKKDDSAADIAPNTVYYSDKKTLRTAAFIGTIVASLLPVLAIAVLYSVKGMPARLGLVAAFTAIFSTCLWFMTDGKLIEVFAATSTFSAVQVVFISTNTN